MRENKTIITAGNMEIYKQLQQLEHINITRILSCEESDGCIVVEEESFQGQTMDVILQKQEIDGGMFYDWMTQICDALECLYAAKPPIAHVSLLPENILVGEDNLLKLNGFSNAIHPLPQEDLQTQDIVAIIAFMKSVEGKFMSKYDSIIQKLEEGEGVHSIAEFRNEINDAYTSRVGIKRAVWVGVIMIILLSFRLIRKLF